MRYLILVIALAGCSNPDMERRYVCDSFSTPWAYGAYITSGGVIRWRINMHDTIEPAYKIPEGNICIMEKRIKGGEK